MIADVSDAFTTLWTQDTCRELRRAGRVGMRPPVAFSGAHTSLPSWVSVKVGDDVYALYVNKCVVYMVSRLRVVDKQRRECCGAVPATWRDPAHPGHDDWAMLGANGCGASPVHVDATSVRFDIAIPGDLLGTLTWRNRRGDTRGLRHVVDGRLERAISLQGLYRLTPESTDKLAALLRDAPESIHEAALRRHTGMPRRRWALEDG
jgi:hypothetical protein